MPTNYNQDMSLPRRGFLASLAAAGLGHAAGEVGKGRIFPSVAARYTDPATEFTILRLTDPAHASVLPVSGNRVLTSRAMLYASDQTGRWEAFRMDLKSRESRQLSEASALDASSLAFFSNDRGMPSDRGYWYFDGVRLIETESGRLRSRELYRVPEPFEKTPGVSYSADGRRAAFAETNGSLFRLRVLDLQRGMATTIVESPEEIRSVRIRPSHSSLFYRLGSAPYSIQFNGEQASRLRLPAEATGTAEWTSDGGSLLYLTQPTGTQPIAALRSLNVDSGEDSLIANTTQFVHFSANADASVFAGASGSKASPYVLLLTRVARREFTLAEHRATDAGIVTPLFGPNSRFVVFGSDRHGKPAIYWIAVDRFVSDTGDG